MEEPHSSIIDLELIGLSETLKKKSSKYLLKYLSCLENKTPVEVKREYWKAYQFYEALFKSCEVMIRE